MSTITTRILRTCPMCKSGTTKDVPLHAVNAYNAGALIQHAWPEGTPVEREFLKTGYCDNCQRILFTPPWELDEDEDDCEAAEDEFYDTYQPHTVTEGGSTSLRNYDADELVGIDPDRIWTLVESDGAHTLLPGRHTVNRLTNIVTDVPWTDADVEFTIYRSED